MILAAPYAPVTSETGLTDQQEACWEARYCTANGHRFNGLNFPLPDGGCLMCEDPAFTNFAAEARALGLTESIERGISESGREALSPAVMATTARPSNTPIYALTQAQRLRRQRGRRPNRKD